jgi:outer membrane protein assembly factor BamB
MPNGEVYAVKATTGQKLWVSEEAKVSARAPSIEAAGQFAVSGETLYVVNIVGELAALSTSDGSLLWKINIAQSFGVEPSLIVPTAIDGAVVARIRANNAYYFDEIVTVLDSATGETEWQQGYQGSVANLAVTGDTILAPVNVGDSSANVLALDLDTGGTKWIFRADGDIAGGITYVGDTAYTSTRDGIVYAFDIPTGKKLWTYKTDFTDVRHAPVVSNGMVIVVNWDAKAKAIGDAPQNRPAATPEP